MLFRPVLIVLFSSSLALAQLERFERDDIAEWALIARIATDFEEFGLTSSQLDKLKESDIKNAFDAFRRDNHPWLKVPKRVQTAQDFLNTVYEVLDEQQEARLHEIMFQRWMNRDELGVALKAFAPNEVKDLESKVSDLQNRVNKRLKETIANLPANREEHEPPLVEFLAWRWGQQIDWLKKELGPVRTQQLVGEPITLAYEFITVGAGRSPFGEDNAGGRLYGSEGGAWSKSNGTEHLTVGPFDPVTGKLDKPDWKKLAVARRNGTDRPKRPIDVPQGWTLDDAWKNLREIEQRSDEVTEKYAGRMNVHRMRRNSEELGVLETKLRIEHGLFSFEIEKAERIIEELGGDPQAEAKAFREAQRLWNSRGFYCNQQPFVSHLNVTAEQHNGLDKIADEYGADVAHFSEGKTTDYHQAILEVLDKKQRRLVKQILFRQYWFSEDCELAFEFTKVTLTDEQKEKIALLRKRRKETLTKNHESQANSMRRMGPVYHMLRPDREKLYKPRVAIVKDYNQTLEEIVGAKNAAALLGEPMKYDPEWKRPVLIPQGLTVQQAKKRYDELATELDVIEGKNRVLRAAVVPIATSAEAGLDLTAARMKIYQLKRKIRIAKRVHEELQAAEEK